MSVIEVLRVDVLVALIGFAAGLFAGLWIHRSSGEIEARARREAVQFVMDMYSRDPKAQPVRVSKKLKQGKR